MSDSFGTSRILLYTLIELMIVRHPVPFRTDSSFSYLSRPVPSHPDPVRPVKFHSVPSRPVIALKLLLDTKAVFVLPPFAFNKFDYALRSRTCFFIRVDNASLLILFFVKNLYNILTETTLFLFNIKKTKVYTFLY